MREIKFRAWNNEDKEMLDNIQNTLFDQFLHSGTFDVMQYTGLKDKNGKEIYEADVVRQEEKVARILWNSLGAYYQLIEVGKLKGCPDLFTHDGKTPYLEIIGNIWQNPELLSAKNELQ